MHFLGGLQVSDHFLCPISLQIMRDPVTTVTGITYDRESIERWLSTSLSAAAVATCPVTQQPLRRDAALTPNHILRRLIQHWCAHYGVAFNPVVNRSYIADLVGGSRLSLDPLRLLESLVAEGGGNRKLIAEAGAARAVASFLSCFEDGRARLGLKEALTFLASIRIPPAESRAILAENFGVTDALGWVLEETAREDGTTASEMKRHAVSFLKSLVHGATAAQLARLRPGFFDRVLTVLRCETGTRQRRVNIDALQILLDASALGPNRSVIAEAGGGAVRAVVELELGAGKTSGRERRTTEMAFGVLFQLCCCAEGREQLLRHRGGVAVVAKRVLRVTPAVDDRGVGILGLLCRFAGTPAVMREMAEVGAVAKIAAVAGSVGVGYYLKDKAKEILSAHGHAWRNSPCVPRSVRAEQTR